MSVRHSRAETPVIEAAPGAIATLPVRRYRDGVGETTLDRLAEEVPVAILCNGEPHAVMLLTPADLEDFALGFALTEGLIEQPRQLVLIEQRILEDGIELDLSLPVTPASNAATAAASPRALAGRSGCGMCGKRMLSEALRVPPPVTDGPHIKRDALVRAAAAVADLQILNRETGAVHAAAWATLDGDVFAVREDIGRHNALDKLIGARARGRFPPGFLVMTSRASYEIVTKAAAAGISLVAAISAPTARAVRMAVACRVTLAGFVRGTGMVIYNDAGRILADEV